MSSRLGRSLVQKGHLIAGDKIWVLPIKPQRMQKGHQHVAFLIPQILRNASRIPDRPICCHPFCTEKHLPFGYNDLGLPF